MSADAWATCPRCHAQRVSEKIAQKQAMDAAYGKVAVEDFDKIRAIAEAPLEEFGNIEEMREDYEFYINEDGIFSADFKAKCKNEGCGFKFTYHHDDNAFVTEGVSDAAK